MEVQESLRTDAQAGESAGDGSAPRRQASAPHHGLRWIPQVWLRLRGLAPAACAGPLLACSKGL